MIPDAPQTPDEIEEKEIDEEYSYCSEILWLHGPAGAGKSAIAQTLAEDCALKNTLAASFFFSRGASDRGVSRYLFTTIAYQLSKAVPEWYNAIGLAIDENRDIFNQSLEVQIQTLIVKPLRSVQLSKLDALAEPSPSNRPFLVIIDGLDECEHDKDQCAILKHISDMVHTHHVPLTFLIASRPEPHIRHIFEQDIRMSTISHSGTSVSWRPNSQPSTSPPFRIFDASPYSMRIKGDTYRKG